jgi:hypothetical protein
MNGWSDEETEIRTPFEKWSRDRLRVELMLYAGNNLGLYSPPGAEA